MISKKTMRVIALVLALIMVLSVVVVILRTLV